MKKLPLQNTETRNIPIAPKLKPELEKDRNLAEKMKNKKSASNLHDIRGNTKESCIFGRPLPFTSKKLLKQIQSIEEQDPNLTDMVEEKLSSPSTAKYIMKKKASKMTVKESRNVFTKMISLDVSGNNIVNELESERQRRALAVRPPARPLDPEPALEDYANLFQVDQFPHSRTVGPSNIFDNFPSSLPKNGYMCDSRLLVESNEELLS